jgi:hypothetical protein
MKIKFILLLVLTFHLTVKAQDETELEKVTENITAENIFKNYLNAIGKTSDLKDVNTLNFKADVTVGGAPMAITAEIKLLTPNKESVEMSAVGMGVISKQKFNGETGYVEQQGSKVELTEKQINSKKGKHSIFPELYPNDSELTLEGITIVNEKDAYKIKVVRDENITYKYYDTESYLLVRSEMTSNSQVKSTIDYSDYKDVNGILFPHKQKITSGMQIITMSYTDIKINEGVIEEDFN